uniref:G-protein coupled receptors family 1 profile domain-containing protein n=1 Tax=Meloidogyne incognita TaxID=6306 RepID=A0A914M2F2_MELIC
MNIVGVPGITVNFFLLYVTVKNKKLRGPTNYLLALTAFFEILHQSVHFLFLFVAVSGINFINYSTALIFQLHSIFGLTAAQTAMCSTAFDRLLAVLFPMEYDQLKLRPYLFVHTFVAFSSGIWMSINAILFANKYPSIKVTGYMSDLLILDMHILHLFMMSLCLLNVIIYLLVWIVVCLHHSTNNINGAQSDIQSRLLKSLILICSIVIGGYVCGTILRPIINIFIILNNIQTWSVKVFEGILTNIGASAETPTLYIFSSLYREVFNKELKKIFCKNYNKNVVNVTPALVISN